MFSWQCVMELGRKRRKRRWGKTCKRWMTQEVRAPALAESCASTVRWAQNVLRNGHGCILWYSGCISHKFGQELLPDLRCLGEWRKATASWKSPNFTASKTLQAKDKEGT